MFARLKIVPLAAVLLFTAAAASAEPVPGGPARIPPGGLEGRGGPPGPGGPSGGDIFISPAGEPFRAPGLALQGAPGEPTGRPGGPGRGLFWAPKGPPPGGGPIAILVRLWFDGADANRDGALERAELLADGRRFFAVLDRDADGRLTDSEISAYETEVAPEILPRMRAPGGMGAPGPGAGRPRGRGPGVGEAQLGQNGPPGGRGGPPGGRGGQPGGPPGGPPGGQPYSSAGAGAAPFGLLADPQPVRSADTNFDMKVSGEEWTAALTRRFAKLDKNGDGRLAFDELTVPGGRPAGSGRRPPPPR